jgi:hypothetical protein
VLAGTAANAEPRLTFLSQHHASIIKVAEPDHEMGRQRFCRRLSRPCRTNTVSPHH